MNAKGLPESALKDALFDAAQESGWQVKQIDGLGQLSGGASKETWSFDLVKTDQSVSRLVLRRQPLSQRFAGQAMARVSDEAKVMRLVASQGVPVPQVAFVLPIESAAGDGYVMARVEGETIGSRILKLPELALARAGMAHRCGEILAQIHNSENPIDLGLDAYSAHESLAALEERYRTTLQIRPVFEFALQWLSKNLPADDDRVLLHGDFRNGNLVVGPEGIRAVLDWELAHIGSRVSDLAWLCVTSWRYQKPENRVGGFGTVEELLAGYQSAGGRAVDLQELHAWEVFQTMNWGVMCAGAAQAFMDGGRSLEGGVIARRASEAEFDLMRLLAPNHGGWDAG